jgi:hypothetical protein
MYRSLIATKVGRWFVTAEVTLVLLLGGSTFTAVYYPHIVEHPLIACGDHTHCSSGLPT